MLIRSLLIGFLLFIATVNKSNAELAEQQTHQQWISGIIHVENEIRFRSFTAHAEGSGFVALAFDRLPGDCSNQYISINVVLPTSKDWGNDSKQYFGALRVDEALMHNITYTIGAAIGSTQIANHAVIVTVQNFDKEVAILDELQRGKNVRFKLGDEFYLRFPLSGFTTASRRSMQLCTGSNIESPDKNYFDNGFRVRTNKDYFRY